MLFLIIGSIIFDIIAAHMSMQYPYPRDMLSGVSYAVWQQNEPMYSVHPTVCHGLDKDTTIRTGNSFTAGSTITATIYGSAPHDGGHCAFWYSTDQTTFTKIIDIKDCTLNSTASVLLPKTMNTACATSCIFAWTWSPVSSGLCEIYMNCADIKVTGVTGSPTSPIQVNFETILATSNCVRVDTTTHFTTIFGTLKTSYLTEDYYGSGGSIGNTTTTQSSATVKTTVAVNVSDDTYCTNPNAPDLDHPITNSGVCNATYRCDDGQCCSSYGFCGPELAGYNGSTPLYYNYNDANSTYWINSSAAVDAYCNNNQGDWRLVKCSSLTNSSSASTTNGTNNNSSDGYKLMKISSSSLMIITFLFVVM